MKNVLVIQFIFCLASISFGETTVPQSASTDQSVSAASLKAALERQAREINLNPKTNEECGYNLGLVIIENMDAKGVDYKYDSKNMQDVKGWFDWAKKRCLQLKLEKTIVPVSQMNINKGMDRAINEKWDPKIAKVYTSAASTNRK